MTSRMAGLVAVLACAGVGRGVGLAAAQAPETPSAIEHIAPSAGDEFLACAGRLLGGPVLVAAGPAGTDASWLVSPPACPGTADELKHALRAVNVNVATADEWIYLHRAPQLATTAGPLGLASALAPSVHVQMNVKDWGVEGRRRLSGPELASIGIGLRLHARTPLVRHVTAGPDGAAGHVVPLQIFAEAVRLGEREPESIVATYGQGLGLARLVVGRLVDGEFVPAWDSPLLSLDRLGYYDLDGDGVDEIVVRGRKGDEGWTFTAFTAHGFELTRQPDAEPWTEEMRGVSCETSGGFSCPITGAAGSPVQFEPRPDGKIDLLAGDWRVSHIGSRLETIRFTLQRGVYVNLARRRGPRWPR